jgi:hypothetical protein
MKNLPDIKCPTYECENVLQPEAGLIHQVGFFAIKAVIYSCPSYHCGYKSTRPYRDENGNVEVVKLEPL